MVVLIWASVHFGSVSQPGSGFGEVSQSDIDLAAAALEAFFSHQTNRRELGRARRLLLPLLVMKLGVDVQLAPATCLPSPLFLSALG